VGEFDPPFLGSLYPRRRPMLHFRTNHAAANRNSARKDLQHPAWVDIGDGSPLRSCTLSDVSRTGAKLAIENPNDMPAEFTLLLTGDGAVRRRCRVMRRGDGEIGVQFLNASPPQSVASTR
jgi:PilZ domain